MMDRQSVDPLVGTVWRKPDGQWREVTNIVFFPDGRLQIKWRSCAANGRGYGGADAPWAWKRWVRNAVKVEEVEDDE